KERIPGSISLCPLLALKNWDGKKVFCPGMEPNGRQDGLFPEKNDGERRKSVVSFTNDRMAIYSYSRQQAIDDGVLVDITEMAQEAGFRFPVAVTRTVWETITPSPTDITQSISGRVWDMLWMLRLAAKGGK